MDTDLRTRPADDASTAQLIGQLPGQLSALVRDELRLAQLELQEKGRRGGLAAGMFGGAGLVALFGAGALVAAAILALATAVDGWLAALIVGGALLLLAGILALTGKKELAQAVPPVPEQAIDSSRRDVAELKEAAHR